MAQAAGSLCPIGETLVVFLAAGSGMAQSWLSQPCGGWPRARGLPVFVCFCVSQVNQKTKQNKNKIGVSNYNLGATTVLVESTG